MFGCCNVPSNITSDEMRYPAQPPQQEERDEFPKAVRTGKSAFVPPDAALARLKEGNDRYVASKAPGATPKYLRKALAVDGQLPMAAVLACADSRCPVERVFDVQSGDVFVCRNAGNAVVQAEGSVVASMEYCMGHLQTKLLVVLGHTNCGAIKGAIASIPAADAGPNPDASVLEGYLAALAPTAKQAKGEMGAGASDATVVAHAVKVNVVNTMSRILEVSEPLRQMVSSGDLKVQGAIYDIATGRVEFLGEAPKAAAKFQPPDRLSGA